MKSGTAMWPPSSTASAKGSPACPAMANCSRQSSRPGAAVDSVHGVACKHNVVARTGEGLAVVLATVDEVIAVATFHHQLTGVGGTANQGVVTRAAGHRNRIGGRITHSHGTHEVVAVAAGKRVGGSIEREIVEPHLSQERESRQHVGQHTPDDGEGFRGRVARVGR